MRALRTWAGRGREEDSVGKALGKLGRGCIQIGESPPETGGLCRQSTMGSEASRQVGTKSP